MPPKNQTNRHERRDRAGPTEPHHAECGDPLKQTPFHTGQDGVFQNNWGDVLCFPYTLCMKFWECGAALCAGTNYCMVYWLILQWIMCKVNQFTTPHPVVYPYFFNIFFQIIALSVLFLTLWAHFGKTVFIPYFKAYITALLEVHYGPATTQKNGTRLSYRKYCFKKFEVFEVPVDVENSGLLVFPNYPLHCMVAVFNYFVSKVVH